MRLTARLCATAAVLTLVAGLPARQAAAADEPQLPTQIFQQLIQDLIDAENKGDAEAMAALFSPGAILLPPGGEVIQGRANIRTFLADYAKRKLDNHAITSTVLLRGGEQSMIQAGTWSGDVPGQNGAAATHVTGTYLAVGIYNDGQWKLWADSWQIKPAAGGAGAAPPQVSASPSEN